MLRSEGGRGGCHGGGEGEKRSKVKICGEGGRRRWRWDVKREEEEREATVMADQSWQIGPIHVINKLEKSHLNMDFASN